MSLIISRNTIWIKLVYLVIFISLIVILLFFHTKGVVFNDEGYILNSALRMVHGQAPYRDFDVAYPPFSFEITSLFIQIFGQSVLTGRIAAFTVSLFSLFAIFKILKLISKNLFIICLSLLFFVFWGPAQINFPSPTMFAVCFFFYTVLFYLTGLKYKSIKYFFITGIIVVLAFLSKQNFGAGMFVSVLVAFMFTDIKNKKMYMLSYAAGVLAAILFFCLILLFTSSFVPFLYNFYNYTIKRIVLEQTLNTPFLYEGKIYLKIAKFLIYSLPLSLSILAFVLYLKSNKNLLIIPIITALFYIIGIRPETDYIHLVPLLSASCIVYAMIVNFPKRIIISKFFIILFILLTGLGFYTAYYKGYYKWDWSLSTQNYFSSNSRLRIFMAEVHNTEAESLIKYIQLNTKTNEKIFVNHYSPLIYFISNRENVSRYDLVGPNQILISQQKEIIDNLKKQNSKLVIMNGLNKDEKSIISNYIKKNYKFEKNIGGYFIFRKN